jgi:hypothetical protein
VCPHRLQGILGGICRDHVVVTQLQQMDEGLPQGPFVFDDEDETGRGSHDWVIGLIRPEG